MKRHFPFPRHNRTQYVRIHVRQCEACGQCAAACPAGVLGVAGFLGHRHAHVDAPDKCKGCGKCVRACPQGAIQFQDPISSLA